MIGTLAVWIIIIVVIIIGGSFILGKARGMF